MADRKAPQPPPNRPARGPSSPKPEPPPHLRQGGWYPPPVTEPPPAPAEPPPPPDIIGDTEWRKAVDQQLKDHEREIEQLEDQISELVRTRAYAN